MSFDLFVICPKFDREVAERFNKLERPGLPTGLSIVAEQGAQDRTFWAIHQNGEQWLELNIRRNEGHGTSRQPADIGADWIEIHIPSRG